MSASPSATSLLDPASATGVHSRALAQENQLLRAALENVPHGLCMFDAQQRLLLANQRYLEVWRLPAQLGRPGTTLADITAAACAQETEQSHAQDLPQTSADRRQREWRTQDGRSVRAAITRLADGRVVALHEDVTEQREAQAQVAHLANHDQLTGLSNRAVLRQALQTLYADTDDDSEVALLCLDLDGFKAVNDRFGHPMGDELLRHVAARLRGCVREGDLVVRLGGDEFAVLQQGGAQPASANSLAKRLITRMAEPFDLNGQRAHVGASIGVAIAPFDGENADALLKHADLALYQAKADGRATHRFFEPGMDARAMERRELEADLHAALQRGEFELAYQAQVEAGVDGARTVNGVEALLRWRHPVRGVVSPADFIPLAEACGLIVPIGRWVLERACADALNWPAHVRVAVNVSPVQFRQGTLLRDVMHALMHTGLPPERLEIEITESVMLQDAEQSLQLLHELRKRGVHTAMDDFGTGYSSLATLRSFPFDRIKIDRSFVRDIETNPDALAIVRAVAGLGRSLGMSTTVEGVETEAQLAAVQREGCGEVQGFLFSRPCPAYDVPALITRLSHRQERPKHV